MKILSVHNSYQQHGGEDEVFASERDLLRSAGHEVVEYVRDNNEIRDYGIWKKATLGLRTVWAGDSAREVQELLKREKPHLAHFHNTFPLISPAAYSACQEAGIPVVQSLHNPRLICPAATLHRDGHVCEDCLGKTLPWPGVLHACYRNSRVQTGVVASMLMVHRYLNTWEKQVNTYLVPTDFYRRKFAEAGLPLRKIAIKPHSVAPDPGQTQGVQEYALFVGRLAAEKGVVTLLKAWERLKSIPLKIRGDGPLESRVRERARDSSYRMELVPRLARKDLPVLLQGARFLVWPSEGYYETFGLVAVEAFACGVPVVASRIGVMAEIVEDGRTGLHFTPGAPQDLAAKIEWAWSHREAMSEMGRAARQEYEAKYTAERNYCRLIGIYRQALEHPHRNASSIVAPHAEAASCTPGEEEGR
jgi:glycosyltransferase involved in cell wall biosynthesis